MTEQQPVVETVNLTKTYEGAIYALDNVNINIGAGEFVAVM